MATGEHNHGNVTSGDGFTVREVNGQSVCQHEGVNGVLVVESGIYPGSDEPGLGYAPESISQALPYNGKQNNLELGTIEEISDQDVYDGEGHKASSFSLGVSELTIVLGDFHRFIVTPTPITSNIPVLVWKCTKDSETDNDVCVVNDGILRTFGLGTSTVTAYDLADPTSYQTVSVTVVDKLPSVTEPEEQEPSVVEP